MTTNPFILSLELDPALAAELTRWRARYFPAERNYLDAHVTLFHALPAEHLADVATDLADVAADRAPFAVRVPGAFSLGRGVALDVVAPEIAALRARLHARWRPWLSPQDRAPEKRQHVTIQNKVTGETAARTLAEVRATWDGATTGVARGLKLWEYLGGPWRAHADFGFEPVN